MLIHEINSSPEHESVLIKDYGNFPNNPELPLFLYREVILFSGDGSPSFVEKTFANNGWKGSWRNGIYPFHHYHSTAHEVLGIYKGSAQVQFGGDSGSHFLVKSGDVVVIPAGVAHKNLQSSHDFRVVGAYPPGQDWDMNYGKEGERPGTDENIKKVSLPSKDPVFGKGGALLELWI